MKNTFAEYKTIFDCKGTKKRAQYKIKFDLFLLSSAKVARPKVKDKKNPLLAREERKNLREGIFLGSRTFLMTNDLMT